MAPGGAKCGLTISDYCKQEGFTELHKPAINFCMKQLTIAFVILVLFTSANAQTPVWDSTYRPTNYMQRVEYFRSYPNSARDIVFLGNSLTHYVDWAELLNEPFARNRGISGDITFGVLERLDEVIEGRPARVFVLIGINDIARSVPDSVILANYRRIIRRIKAGSPATKIYFQTLMPVNNEVGSPKNHYNKDEHIAVVNEGLKKLAAREKVMLIDLHPHFSGKDGKLEKSLTYDGLHLNAEGYKVWAKVLKEGKYLW